MPCSTFFKVMGLGFAIFCGPVAALTMNVSTTKDQWISQEIAEIRCIAADENCSVREAIAVANKMNGPDIINIPGGWYKLTLPEALQINDSLTIQGSLNNVIPPVIEGNFANPILSVNFFNTILNRQLTLKNLWLLRAKGAIHDSGSLNKKLTLDNCFITNMNGNGVLIWDGDVDVKNSTIRDNVSSDFVFQVVAPFKQTIHTVKIENSLIQRNTCQKDFCYAVTVFSKMNQKTIQIKNSQIRDNQSGGIKLEVKAGANSNFIQVAIDSSLIFNNTTGGISYTQENNAGDFAASFALRSSTVSRNGGSALIYAVIGETDPAAVTNFSISNSLIAANTDAGFSSQDGILLLRKEEGDDFGISKFVIDNTTFSSNQSDNPLISSNLSMPLQLFHVTIAKNKVATGIFRGNVNLQNTLIDQPSVPCNSNAVIASLGNNLDAEKDCGFSHPADINGSDPMLGTLSLNGGTTGNYPLLPGSPAIDAGKTLPNFLADQRGIKRPQGLSSDIGAFEFVAK